MNLNGAEIFSVGTWNDLTFEEADLHAIVRAFAEFESSGRVPLKFGHNDSQALTDGKPALGWVERVWTDGKKLFADFKDIPSVVYEAIKRGLYKFVSVELLRGVEREGRSSPWVLDAVALLGADPPAVSNLKDLQALTLSRMAGIRFDSRVAFTLATDDSQLNGGRKAMAESNDKGADALRELTEKVALMAADVAKFTGENASLKAQVETLQGEITKRDAAAALAATKAHRDSIKARFEDAVTRRVLSPAARDLFYRMQGVDDDARVVTVTKEIVDEYLKVNAMPGDGRAAFSRAGSGRSGDGGGDRNIERPDQAVAAKVAEEIEKNENLTYQQAIVRVFRREPELGRQYLYQRG